MANLEEAGRVMDSAKAYLKQALYGHSSGSLRAAQTAVKLLKRHKRTVRRDRYVLYWWAVVAASLCGLAVGAWLGWMDL